MSEIYKDVLALRDIGFSEVEIRDMMKGRRAVSKQDINSIMLGLFEAEKVPALREDSGVRKAIDQINRETQSNYTIVDFIDKPALANVRAKYQKIPLGLSESERDQFLKTTPEGKEKFITPRIEQQIERIEGQQGAMPQTPIPNVPMPDVTPVAAAVDQNTGLTRTEQALLSPDEQLIAQRNRGILSLV